MNALPSPALLAEILEDFRRIWKLSPAEAKPAVFDQAFRFVRGQFRYRWSTHQLEQELLALLFITNRVQASSYAIAAEAGEAWEREAQSPVCLPRPPLSKRFYFRRM